MGQKEQFDTAKDYEAIVNQFFDVMGTILPALNDLKSKHGKKSFHDPKLLQEISRIGDILTAACQVAWKQIEHLSPEVRDHWKECFESRRTLFCEDVLRMFDKYIDLPGYDLSPKNPVKDNCANLLQSYPQTIWRALGTEAASRDPATALLIHQHREAMESH